MKTPKEYLNFIEFAEVDASEAGVFYFADNLEKGELIKLIKQVQKEAWNEALDKAAESAEIEERDYKKSPLKTTNLGQEISSEYEGVYYGIDKQSILKLKI